MLLDALQLCFTCGVFNSAGPQHKMRACICALLMRHPAPRAGRAAIGAAFEDVSVPESPSHATDACVHAQYDLTWFITPEPAPYYEAVILEHGYTRGEANATNLHIQVRAA